MSSEATDRYRLWADAVRGRLRPAVVRELIALREEADGHRRELDAPEPSAADEGELAALRDRADLLRRRVEEARARREADEAARRERRRSEADALLAEAVAILRGNDARRWHELIEEADALGPAEDGRSWGEIPPARLPTLLGAFEPLVAAREAIREAARRAAEELAAEAETLRRHEEATRRLDAIRAEREGVERHLRSHHGMAAEVIERMPEVADSERFFRFLDEVHRVARQERDLRLPGDVFRRLADRGLAAGGDS